MLVAVPVLLQERRLGDYAGVTPQGMLGGLRLKARPLAGLRVLHLSASPFASAVAETLGALVPLQRSLVIEADWQILNGGTPRVWSTIYEGLNGAKVRWGWKERNAWYQCARGQAASIPSGYDVIVVHDPQPTPLAQVRTHWGDNPRWIWHCHSDIRGANPEVRTDLFRAVQGYDAALFPSPDLVPRDAPVPLKEVARPAVDPCSLRNAPLPPSIVEAITARIGLDPARPILGQFGPLDHRFEPLAALGTFWLARREIPGLQIVLADLATGLPIRFRHGTEQVLEAANGDPDIRVLTPEADLGATGINALQRTLSIALQLAVPAGFGRSLAECHWKGKPSVVGPHGQLPEQVADGEAGVVARGALEAASAVVELLRSPIYAQELGRRARAHVEQNYLITGLAADYVDVLRRLTSMDCAIGGDL